MRDNKVTEQDQRELKPAPRPVSPEQSDFDDILT